MMKKIYHLCVVLMAMSGYVQAQFDCNGSRFLQNVFPAYDSTVNLQYGQNYDHLGNLQILDLDIYEPVGDTASLRPLLIMTHGGNFLGGDKAQGDVAPLCREFAKKGYVTCSINYRVGMENFPFPGPDSVDAAEAVYRATHDARAAVRFFHKDVAISGNTWRIDTNYIFFGGSSAGGLTALHLAYMDEIAEIPSYIDTTKLGHGGGVAGLSGNPGYSAKVKAIINISGALGDTAWMKPGDTPVLSFHGDQDGVVPFGSEMIYLLGQYPLLEVDGSYSVHAKAQEIGIENCFKPFWGADHTPHWGSSPDAPFYYDTTSTMMRDFMYHYTCGGPMPADCYQIIGVEEPLAINHTFSIYPNPASGDVTVDMKENTFARVCLMDCTGRTLRQYRDVSASLTIAREDLPAGMYFIRVEDGLVSIAKKLVLN